MRILIFILVATVFSFGATVYGADKLYKWVDKSGRVSYHDHPAPPDSGYRVEEKKTISSPDTAKVANPDGAKRPPVVLYSAPKCSSCDLARGYLQKRKVPFVEKNVDGDRKLQEELIKQSGGLSVPTITVGEKTMRGYLESLLEGELDQAGYPKLSEPEQQPPTP